MQEKTKNVLLVVLIVGLVSMTVAYAALSTTLTINSSAKVAASNWSVKIANWTKAAAQANPNGGTSEATATEPSITDTSISDLEITFKKPGDSIKFTFNLVNDGDINAQLNTVNIGTSNNANVTNEVVCGSGTKVTPVDKNTNSSMDLVKTTGSIPCEMTVTYSAAAGVVDSETAVTISPTTFVYGQK